MEFCEDSSFVAKKNKVSSAQKTFLFERKTQQISRKKLLAIFLLQPIKLPNLHET
jgi:hypothetical protein